MCHLLPLKCWTSVQHLHLCNLILWLQWLFYQLIYAFAFCFNFEAGINEGWHLKTKKKHLEMRFLELYGCSDQQGLRGLPASAHSQVQRWSQKTNKGGCRQQAASMTHWATEGIPFFKGAFILKDNQRRSICQQARVPSHSSEGADMGVRKHISRLSLSQSLSHFRTHSFPQFEKKRGHTCVHSTQNRKDCVEETLIIALGFNAKWDRHCPTPALF